MKWLVCAAVALLGSCQSDAFDVDSVPAQGPVAPNAHAGTGTTVRVGTTVMLDASASFDPDGTVVSYGWEPRTRPVGASAWIASPSAMIATVVLDVPGAHEFRVTVTDDDGERDMETIVFVAADPGAAVDAGAARDVTWHTRVTLDGEYALEDPSDEAAVMWRFVTVPGTVAPALDDASTLTPSFLATDVGTYVLELAVTTGSTTSVDQVVVRVEADMQELPEFSSAQWASGVERFVFFAEGEPETLVAFDPTTSLTSSIDLGSGSNMTGLSLDPSGTRAALTTGNALHIIDLDTSEITDSFGTEVEPAPFDYFVVVYGSNGRVHMFPHSDAFGRVRTIDLSTSAVTTTPTMVRGFNGATERAGTTEIYTHNFEGLVEWDGSASPVTPVRSVANLAVAMSFSPTGTFAISQLGSVVDLPALTERAQICAGLDGCSSLHHPGSHTVATVGRVTGMASTFVLQLWDDTAFTLRSTATVPALIDQSQYVVAMGFSATGGELYVIFTGADFSGGRQTRLLTVPL